MGTPRSPHGKVIAAMAAEGIHSVEAVIAAAARAVPIGPASRATIANRVHCAAQRGYQVHEQGTHPHHARNLWEPGARDMARNLLWTLRIRGRVVVEDGIVRLP